MIYWDKNRFSVFAITKYKRILNYLKNLEENIIIKNKDKKVILDIEKLIDDRINRLKKLYIISNILYFAIYFSFISFFFSDFFILSKLTILISKFIGLFGTTTFLIGLFFTNKIKELYYQDLNLLSSHLITIYTKNHINENNDIFSTNNYNTFIKFFKKRGF